MFTNTHLGQRVLKSNIVLIIAVAAAVVTAFIVPPDAEYIGYFDFKTLACLFSVLAVVGAFRNIRLFYLIAKKVVSIFTTTRSAVLALVISTLIGSMFMTNDMALITFLPLGYIVLSKAGKEELLPFTFIMQNMAANLGGMILPFGNPQNLYLYSKFGISNADFIITMFPPFALSVVMIVVCCLFVKSEPVDFAEEEIDIDKKRAGTYVLLFILAILTVCTDTPFLIAPLVIVCALLFFDRTALKNVDYGLLFTFVAFFVFAGNMSRMPAVHAFLSGMLAKNALVTSALASQFISNVPAAVLLSQFTADWQGLLAGVNIGGAGTLIASLASLITFAHYRKYHPEGTGRYILLFSIFNFGFLAVLLAFMSLI